MVKLKTLIKISQKSGKQKTKRGSPISEKNFSFFCVQLLSPTRVASSWRGQIVRKVLSSTLFSTNYFKKKFTKCHTDTLWNFCTLNELLNLVHHSKVHVLNQTRKLILLLKELNQYSPNAPLLQFNKFKQSRNSFFFLFIWDILLP